MLTSNQEKYLLTIPEDKKISIQPFDPKVKETGLQIVKEIENKLPQLNVHFGGASALGIAGQNDIDLNALSSPDEYSRYLPGLITMFGEPAKNTPNLVKWEFDKNGFEVELYLTDRDSTSLQEQIKTFELIQNNQDYKKEYEQIKLACDGLSFREYMRRKYEFFNKILAQ